MTKFRLNTVKISIKHYHTCNRDVKQVDKAHELGGSGNSPAAGTKSAVTSSGLGVTPGWDACGHGILSATASILAPLHNFCKGVVEQQICIVRLFLKIT